MNLKAKCTVCGKVLEPTSVRIDVCLVTEPSPFSQVWLDDVCFAWVLYLAQSYTKLVAESHFGEALPEPQIPLADQKSAIPIPHTSPPAGTARQE